MFSDYKSQPYIVIKIALNGTNKNLLCILSPSMLSFSENSESSNINDTGRKINEQVNYILWIYLRIIACLIYFESTRLYINTVLFHLPNKLYLCHSLLPIYQYTINRLRRHTGLLWEARFRLRAKENSLPSTTTFSKIQTGESSTSTLCQLLKSFRDAVSEADCTKRKRRVTDCCFSRIT